MLHVFLFDKLDTTLSRYCGITLRAYNECNTSVIRYQCALNTNSFRFGKIKTNFVSAAHELNKTLALSVRVCDDITQLTPAFYSIYHSQQYGIETKTMITVITFMYN